MPQPEKATKESFRAELQELVEKFHKGIAEFKSSTYDERALRSDFLDRLWRVLGWDLENRGELPQTLREVDQETRVDVGGRKKRADYTFRTDGMERFVCEAKKPREELTDKYAYQVQRYAFNLKVRVALLTDFEGLHVFIVGGKPDPKAPFDAYYRWHFTDYLAHAEEIWGLFSRHNVAGGSLERFIAGLPKKPIKGRPRQGWLIPPQRVRTVDAEFLGYIEEQREILARDLVRENKEYRWDDPTLNEAVQRILDRILFVRICEDRDIDTGRALQRIVDDWRRVETARPPLYPRVVGHFQSLDEPFNGALFRRGHLSEQLRVTDKFLVDFIGDLSSEDSPYLFSTLPVEILGSVYERFIGRVVHVTKSRTVTVHPKPEVRKAGGVYYTPRYIVDYIVEHTLGQLLEGKSPKEVSRFRILDPACGSGGFLIRAFERICEHYLKWYHNRPKDRREENCYRDAEGNLRLTTHLKRQILLDNIFGVDLDPQAIEVTMLSLYLKILEGETRSSLGRQQRLFPKESFLPDLKNNIRLGNSLIESDYFDLFSDGDERTRIKPFDWKVEFREIMDAGGFDAVIGNPPYVTGAFIADEQASYLKSRYKSAFGKFDLYMTFLERAIQLSAERGFVGFIIPNKFMATQSGKGLREFLSSKPLKEIVDFGDSGVFEGVTNYPCIVLLGRDSSDKLRYRLCNKRPEAEVRQVLVRRDAIDDHPWCFTASQEAPILQRIESSRNLRLDAVVNRFATGIQTGADKILQFTEDAIRSRKLERSYLRMCLRGRNVRRYLIEWDGRFVFWPYDRKSDAILDERSVRRRARQLYKALLANKTKLARRIWFGKSAEELSGAWYGLMYREPDKNFQALHIATPCLSSQVNFALNEEGYRFVTGTAGVMGILPKDNSRENCLYLLGLLNSKMTEFFIKRRSPRFAGGFYKFTAPYLKNLPIPKLDVSQQSHRQQRKKASELAARMLDLVGRRRQAKSDAERQTLENAIRATDSQIDELVYDLYGLTATERRLVEQAVGN